MTGRGREALFKAPTVDPFRRLVVFLKVWTQILRVWDLLKIAACEILGVKRALELKPRGLSHSIELRALTTDIDVLRYVLHDQYHLPPAEYIMPPLL